MIGRPQVQLVLAHLLLERRPTTPGGLADLLWGEQPLGPHWRGAVRGVLSKVRDACEAAGIDAVVAVQGDGAFAIKAIVQIQMAVPAHIGYCVGAIKLRSVYAASRVIQRASGREQVMASPT